MEARKRKRYKKQLTKRNLKIFLDNLGVLLLIVMGLAFIFGSGLLVFNIFWQLVFK